MKYILMFVCLLMNVVVADELNSPIYAGVWSGKIGNVNVNVCFINGEGQYFYVKHLKGIRLERTENSDYEWLEKVRNVKAYDMDVTGTWRIDGASDLRMNGAWFSPNGSKELKIELIKKASPKNDYECGEGFYEPIVRSIKYKYLPMKFGNIQVRSIETGAGTAFEVTSDTPGYKKINGFIKNWMKQQAIESYECELNGGGGWHAELRPMYMIGNFMVINDNLPDTYCGGAHGGWSTAYYTVDVGSGGFVNTWSWIKGGESSVESGSNERPKKKLRKLIEKLNPRDDCSDTNDYFSVGAPYPSDKGLVFTTHYPYVVRACEDEVLVTYGMINKFLTHQGVAAIKKLQK